MSDCLCIAIGVLIKVLIMRKIYPLIIMLLVFYQSVSAQSKNSTVIIRFKDKGTTKYSIHKPSDYLSDRAIERRLIQNIPVDNTDLPVNPDYIKAIEESGAEVFFVSKWLNLAIAYVDDFGLLQIDRLPFVKKTEVTSLYSEIKTKKSSKRPFSHDKMHKLSKKMYKHASGTDFFDYGMAFHQAQMLRINELHNQGYTGNGMIMAIIDAGYNSANQMEVFDSLFNSNRILGTRDFVEPGNNVYAESMSGHGTSVLSTIAANSPGRMIGTAPHASFYLLRSEDANDEYLMEEYYWVSAAEYADSVGVDVINTSLGYSTFDNSAENHTYIDMDGNTTPITIAADLAAKKGMLMVNSAGNEGSNSWRYITAPADGDSVLTIGAVDEDGLYAYFSSTGPTADGRIKPDVVALGYNTTVAYPGGGIGGGSGTSYSSPIIAGAAACLWQANPTYNNMEIYNAIKQSGSKASNPDNQIGWGIPDFMLANAILVGNVGRPAPEVNVTTFPNPFTDSFIVEISVQKPVDILITLIDSKGVIAKNIGYNSLITGSNLITVDNLENLNSGLYLLQIISPEFSKSIKILK